MNNIFDWMQASTNTSWYVDSAEYQQVLDAKIYHVHGVTTNPMLVARALKPNPEQVSRYLSQAGTFISPSEKAAYLVLATAKELTSLLSDVYEATHNTHGYVCAQVDPSLSNNREAMLEMAKQFAAISPQILVKLPATAAGMDILEECTALGINTTGTVSFSMSQLIAIAERYEKGLKRLSITAIKPTCLAVLMVGRLEDFLVGSLRDRHIDINDDVLYATEIVGRRAYSYFHEHNYSAKICISGIRTPRHFTPYLGADVVLSISPAAVKKILESNIPQKDTIDNPSPENAIKTLMKYVPFRQMYEPDGLSVDEFYTFGETQHTMTQFIESGWNVLKEL